MGRELGAGEALRLLVAEYLLRRLGAGWQIQDRDVPAEIEEHIRRVRWSDGT